MPAASNRACATGEKPRAEQDERSGAEVLSRTPQRRRRRLAAPGAASTARQRVLPAALVIVMRHSRLGLLNNDEVKNFDPNDLQVQKAVEQLKRRCELSVPDNKVDEVNGHIDALIEEWQNEAERCKNVKRQLDYEVPAKESGRDRLLYNHDDPIRGLWPILQSMRDVENTAMLEVL